MTRKAKALGAALGAILVLVAMAAPGAQAQQGLLTAEEEVTLTGEETGEGANRVTAFGAAVECPGSTGTGHKVEATPHELLPATSTEITLTPHIREVNSEGQPNCVAPGLGWTATADFNGCDYVVHAGQAVEEHTYGGSVDIVCPAGQEILWTFWTNAAAHESEPESPFCVLHVPPQAGLEGALAVDTDTNDGHVEVVGEGAGITVHRKDPNGHGSIFCPDETETSNAKLHLDLTISGHNALGEPVAIKLSHE